MEFLSPGKTTGRASIGGERESVQFCTFLFEMSIKNSQVELLIKQLYMSEDKGSNLGWWHNLVICS